MDTKQNQNPSKKPPKLKRLYAESDSNNDTDQTLFLNFIMLESTEDTPITNLSPFIIEKLFKKINQQYPAGRNAKKSFLDLLQEQKNFHNLKIKAYPHNSLNLSKGVVRSLDLSLCTLDEIKSNLCKQGVTDAKWISIKRNNQIILTNTYILDFNTPKPPTEIKIDYLITKVETYISNPPRCHNCQKFGHHKEKCTRPLMCKNRRETGNHIDCQQLQKCANYKQNHSADSKECELWKKRKKITWCETYKKYILLGCKDVHWKFSSHSYLCKHSQTHRQLYQKSRNDDSLQHDKSNKGIQDSTWITKSTKITQTKEEKNKIKFTSDNTDGYNQPFTLTKLQNSISKSKNSVPGPDEIHYTLLKELPTITLKCLLDIYSSIWISGNIPTIWKQAITIPLLKKPKDPTNPTSYRPI